MSVLWPIWTRQIAIFAIECFVSFFIVSGLFDVQQNQIVGGGNGFNPNMMVAGMSNGPTPFQQQMSNNATGMNMNINRPAPPNQNILDMQQNNRNVDNNGLPQTNVSLIYTYIFPILMPFRESYQNHFYCL